MMTDLTIRDDLAEQLHEIARHENRPIDEVLESLLGEYRRQWTKTHTERLENYESALKQLRPRLYAQARQYWQEVNDQARLKLTDEELDKQFWLIDHEGIPRLKTDQDKVVLPDNSLVRLAENAWNMDFQASDPDISNRSREILENEWGDYLLRRLHQTDKTPDE